MLYSPLVEKALRLAAVAHRSQFRKGTDIPYLTHLASVALILARAGFDDDELLAASILHDIVEDGGVPPGAIRKQFGDRVAAWVEEVSEVKCDEAGRPLPWRHRKEEHLRRLGTASSGARAITLADKLHNLCTLIDDASIDRAVWTRFNASRADSLWYYEAVVDAASPGRDDERLNRLAAECRASLVQLRRLP